MVQSPSPVVKLGAWGNDAGAAHDIDAAPHRLESIAIRWGKVIDSVAFTYTDKGGQLHTAGPWGGTGGEKEDTITLGPTEYVTQVAWSVGPFQLKEIEDCVTSLKFVTNRGATYGPFGRGDGVHHSLPVLDGGSLVGMFCRAGDYLHAISFYVRPLAVVKPASPAKPEGESLPTVATKG
ncbi:hypothetical protein CFC21_053849 [Triticum aestivum]|uniref:Jacalin-type lectin domain-containing protein n=2 Tax=Triticum aestivum TaxID=4565 RepID=A0A9R1K8B8_WHEAT|nr:horcolin-like isoform X2 [Triticum aestivum]KAF7044650.1 hypothetical protein CFC21_053849 [Triticum aestivum]